MPHELTVMPQQTRFILVVAALLSVVSTGCFGSNPPPPESGCYSMQVQFAVADGGPALTDWRPTLQDAGADCYDSTDDTEGARYKNWVHCDVSGFANTPSECSAFLRATIPDAGPVDDDRELPTCENPLVC